MQKRAQKKNYITMQLGPDNFGSEVEDGHVWFKVVDKSMHERQKMLKFDACYQLFCDNNNLHHGKASGDGHCFFHCLSQIVFRVDTIEYITALRRLFGDSLPAIKAQLFDLAQRNGVMLEQDSRESFQREFDDSITQHKTTDCSKVCDTSAYAGGVLGCDFFMAAVLFQARVIVLVEGNESATMYTDAITNTSVFLKELVVTEDDIIFIHVDQGVHFEPLLQQTWISRKVPEKFLQYFIVHNVDGTSDAAQAAAAHAEAQPAAAAAAAAAAQAPAPEAAAPQAAAPQAAEPQARPVVDKPFEMACLSALETENKRRAEMKVLLDEKNSIEANIVKYRHAYDHSIQVELELKEAVAAAARDVEEAKIAKKNIRDVRVVFACAFNE